jgi:hypothetical protein
MVLEKRVRIVMATMMAMDLDQEMVSVMAMEIVMGMEMEMG